MKKIFTSLFMLFAVLAINAANPDITLSSSADISNMELKNYNTVTVAGGFTLSTEDIAKLQSLILANDVNMLDLTDAQFAENTIPERAFYNSGKARKLVGVTFPKSVTSIGKEAFRGNSKLYNIVFPAGSQLQTIGESAFQDCGGQGDNEVTDLVFPQSLVEVGTNAFRSSGAKTVSFEAGSKCTKIGQSSFINTKKMDSAVIPASVTALSGEAFSNSSIKTVTFEDSNNKLAVGKNAFGGSTVLTSIKLMRSVVPALNGEGVFADHTAELTVPEGSLDAYKADPEFSQFTNIKTAVINGIRNINVEKENSDNAIYNLAGQRVNANAKGILIINGKKVIRK